MVMNIPFWSVLNTVHSVRSFTPNAAEQVLCHPTSFLDGHQRLIYPQQSLKTADSNHGKYRISVANFAIKATRTGTNLYAPRRWTSSKQTLLRILQL